MAIENQEIDYSDAKSLLLDLINNMEINEKKDIERKIIFWYDSSKEYTSVILKIKKEIDNDETEILIFDNNSFWIRYHVQIEEPTKNFVIYFPYERKRDIQNDLLDLDTTSGYEQYFNPDNTTKIIIELGLSDDNRAIIKDNKKFFGNQIRRDKFKEFDAEKNNSTINYINTAILLGIKSINEDEILKNIVKEFLTDSNKFKQVESFGNKDFILRLFNKNFGVNIKEYSDLDNLLNNLVMTYFISALDNKNKLDRYADCLVSQKFNSQVFISSLMNDKTTSKVFENLSNKVYEEFGLSELFNVEDSIDYIESDAFRVIDYNIIRFIINQLNGNSFNYEDIKNIILKRQSKFWYSKFENEYNTILHVIEYLKDEKVGIYKIKTADIETLTKLYTEELYKIDFDYRKILYYYDQIKDKDDFKELIQTIENHYTNNFMFELSVKWDDSLEKLPNYDSNKLVMQNKFFDKYIKPEVTNSKGGRVIVIISDAFRYDMAKELNYKLTKLAKNSEIKYMLGLVPSYTKLGKAVLLPNKKVSMIENSDDILIDGKRTSSTEDREKILQSVVPESLAIQYDDLVNNYKKADWKKLFSGKKIIYIYHDVVDKVGENDSDSVFDAGEKAITQLYDLIESLHKTFSGVNVFLTADHGFFYKREDIKQVHKVSKMEGVDKQKTRYSYSKNKSNNDSVISFKLDYIFDNYDGYVEIPTGHNVFTKQGVSDKYFHGGDLPQELIIPLIDFKSARVSKEINKVGLVYSGFSYKITNSIVYLNFTQNTNVDENNAPCEYVVYFEDNDKNKISNEIKIIANRTEPDYNDRIFKEKFIFKSIDYSINKSYYLVIREEGQNFDISRQKFDIDIAFSNNFDF